MSYKILISPIFEIDLAEIDFYLSEYPKKVKRIIEKIDKALPVLANMPKIHPVYEDFPVFRKMIVEDYLIFYLVNEKEKNVEIHRLIYGRMDLKSVMFGIQNGV